MESSINSSFKIFDKDLDCKFCYKVCKNGQNSICCDICNMWIHLKCSKICLSQFKKLSLNDMPLLCYFCIHESLPFSSLNGKEFGALFSAERTFNSLHKFKYLCTQCYKPCKNNQNAIQCDWCSLWTHVTCSDLSQKNFQTLCIDSSQDFVCKNCFFNVFPFQVLNDNELQTLFLIMFLMT